MFKLIRGCGLRFRSEGMGVWYLGEGMRWSSGVMWGLDEMECLIDGEGDMVWLGEAHVMEMAVVCIQKPELGWGFTAFFTFMQ